MRVPKFFFRNLRSEPRQFQFRSPYHDPKHNEIEARKKKIEDEVRRENGLDSEQVLPSEISFDRSRRAKKQVDNRWATMRTVIILVILCFLLFKGLQWADSTDFGNIIDLFKNG